MAIGSGIFLIAVGAILAFALNETVDAVNLVMVGWILMGAGAIGIIVSLIVNGQRRNTTHTQVREEHVDHHDVQHRNPDQRNVEG
ncbi:DUF6458 family protein [Demequina sediminicola]|uniref:DUF6458 family protein n=1 Tax=Demequina sediminicola TaxID=1095026 RepID=UPI000782CADC|nr:DUF6458 family protein [Demequina sediminicola]